MNDEEKIKRKFLEYLADGDLGKLGLDPSYTMWTTPSNPPKRDKGYQPLTVELKELMRDWLSSSGFSQYITVAERLLVHEYLRAGEYNEEGKEALNLVRKKWIKYLEENNLR